MIAVVWLTAIWSSLLLMFWIVFAVSYRGKNPPAVNLILGAQIGTAFSTILICIAIIQGACPNL